MCKTSVTKIKPSKKEISETFQTGQIITISAGHFIHDIYSSFLAPWLPLLIKNLNLSLTLAGSLTIYIRVPSLLNPVIGTIADRIDMRYLFITAPAVTAVCMSLIGLAHSYVVVAMLLLCTGLSAAAFHVPAPVMISMTAGQRLGRGMSFFMAAGELARTIGPLLAVMVVSLLGFHKSYPVMLIGLMASSFLYWRMRHCVFHYSRKHYASIQQTWKSLKHVFIPCIFLILARALMISSLTVFLPTFLKIEGKSLWIGGASLSILELAGTFGTLTSGTSSDHLGRRFVLLAAMTISPILMLLFIFTQGWLQLVILILMGFSSFSTSPVMLAIIQDHAQGMRATANGIYMGISFIVMSGIAVIVGWMGDIIGLKAAFAWSAVAALLGVPIIFLLPKENLQKKRN